MSLPELRDKSFEEMQAEIYDNCVKKGWYDKEVSFGDATALLHSEVSEAFEAWRKWGAEDATEPVSRPEEKIGDELIPKPEGVGSEFADVLIRLLDYCNRWDINLLFEYERKMHYNRSRPYRHGGKRL